ncbi:MAG: DUF1015 domain-containing protein [Clostridia bacterium]|nr:DUF1015 domain-containing protein [Clostridia bacterium]
MKLEKIPFGAADILVPATDFEKWACVACDQFTSEPQYWLEVAKTVGGAPSAFNLIIPEVWLGVNDAERAERINAEMHRYLNENIFTEHPDSMVYVERTLPDGSVRRGLVGAVDLEAYDYAADSKSPVRATEGTVISRIPPRVAVREGASIEMPHIMLLIDDIGRSVIEPLKDLDLPLLYDFELMQGGGRIRGYLIDRAEVIRNIEAALSVLAEKTAEGGVLIAMGDGNHSLATAKECYRRNPTERNRYALAELVNIHDEALVFEPIYRVVFGCDPGELLCECEKALTPGKNKIEWHTAAGKGELSTDELVTDVLQRVIDAYVASHPGAECDYVHGVESTLTLAKEKDDRIAFIFDGMDKSELFSYVENKGALPRKTFSMGEAESKRYYIEARRIDAK